MYISLNIYYSYIIQYIVIYYTTKLPVYHMPGHHTPVRHTQYVTHTCVRLCVNMHVYYIILHTYAHTHTYSHTLTYTSYTYMMRARMPALIRYPLSLSNTPTANST